MTIWKANRKVTIADQAGSETGPTGPYPSTNMTMIIASKNMLPLPALGLISSVMTNGDSSISSGTKPQTKLTKSPRKIYRNQFAFRTRNLS